MAERRMVSKVISISEKVNSMSLFGRLLYTWMIPHADDFGRMPGSPMKVRALVVPMGDETPKDVEAALTEMQERGLINWYEIAGERYIQISNFDDHQQGLHKRTKSKFPEPSTPNEDIPGTSGNFPNIPPELELNRTELNTTTTAHARDCHSPIPEQDEPQTMMDAHHQVFGTNIIPSNHSKVLIPIMMRSGEAYAIELILEAGEAAKGGAPSIRYVQEIDVRWQKDRIKSREEAKSKKPQTSNRFDPNERKQTQNQLAKQKIREAEERDRIRSTQTVLPHRELI